jgi:hypothetical protein
VNVAASFDGGTAAYSFTGSVSQAFTLGVDAEIDGDITINKSGGSVIQVGTFTLNASSQDFIVTAGTYNLNGSALTVNGTSGTLIVQNGATLQLQGAETLITNGGNPQLQAGSTVKYTGTSGPYTLKNYSYKNLVIAGADSSIFTLPESITVGENLLITTGILSQNGQSLSVTGIFSNNGTLRRNQNDPFTGTMDTDSGTVEYVGNGDSSTQTINLPDYGSTDYYNLVINDLNSTTDTFQLIADLAANSITVNSGTFTGGSSAITVNDNLDLFSGTFNATSNTLSVGGNFSHSGGTFTHNSGTVTLIGSDQALLGSTTFNNLAKSVTTAATLTLPAGTTQTITGTLTLNGASGQNLSLRSSSVATQALLDPQGTRTISYLDVQDNNNSNLTTISCISTCTDSGNNSGWSFVTPGFTISAISGDTTEAGSAASFTLVLLSAPTSEVNIGLNSSNTAEGTVAPASLIFTANNWSTPQTVTVTGVDDATVDDSITFSIITAAASSTDPNYNGLNPDDISVVNADDDTAGVTFSAPSVSGIEGQITSYTAVLSTQPSTEVLVVVTPDSQSSVNPSGLNFTSANWNAPQTIQVTLIDDTIVEGAHSGTIAHTVSSGDSNYNALTLATVAVDISDNDIATATSSSGGGGGNGIHHSSSSTSSTTTSSTNTTTITNVQEAIESTSLEHWASGYIKNALEENFIIEIALAKSEFMDLLSAFVLSPDNSINRSSTLTFLLVQSGIDISTLTVNTNRTTFSDINSGDENYSSIAFAQQAGLVNGYPDGSFQPSRIINRVETLKIVSTFYQNEVPSDLRGEELLAYYGLEENPFSDIDLNEWYAPYVIATYSNGVIKGYEDGTFKPDREVSHAEFLKVSTLGKDIDNAVQLASELE